MDQEDEMAQMMALERQTKLMRDELVGEVTPRDFEKCVKQIGRGRLLEVSALLSALALSSAGPYMLGTFVSALSSVEAAIMMGDNKGWFV